MNLGSIDLLILLLYVAAVVGTGLKLKPRIQSSEDFLQAGQGLSAGVCGLALFSISLGLPELIGMSAWGAGCGFAAVLFCGLGAIPAMIFAGIFVMPVYSSSKARTVPEYLYLRFGGKTRALSASLFIAMAIFSSGLALYLLARIVQSLHLLDGLFYALGWPIQGTFPFVLVLAGGIVLLYILLGGLRGTIYNAVLQFAVMVAGLLPVVFLGLKNVGGWSGMKAAAAAVDPHLVHAWRGILAPAANSMSLGIFALGFGLVGVLGAGYWCTDFRAIQMAMAARNSDAARRVPLIAAIPKAVFPLLVLVPGLIAIGLPTPHTTTVVSEENGAIIHTTHVVTPEVEHGRGLVPACLDRATDKLILNASGKPRLDYEMVLPKMLQHFLPTGLLGLGLAALLASLMSGTAGSVTACNAVWMRDLYQPYLHKNAPDAHYLKVSRYAAVVCVVLAIYGAYAAVHLDSVIDALLLAFTLVNAPLLAVLLLGMFWKRATGQGALSGLVAGVAAAVAHYGLTLPADARPGIRGGWLVVMQRYPTDVAQNLYGAIFACGVSCAVALIVSLLTRPKSDAELAGLVYSLVPRSSTAHSAWWKHPEALRAAVLIVAIMLGLALV